MKFTIHLLFVFLGAIAPISAQEFAGNAPGPASGDEEAVSAQAPDIVFSNLAAGSGDLYNSNQYEAVPVAGKNAANGQTETWEAVRFVPKNDVQVKLLRAAVQWISGTRLVRLGIYDTDPTSGKVGDPIPGGEALTTDIPDLGQCCQLATVKLKGSGVALTKGVSYWLVAHADKSSGSDFSGAWCLSFLSDSAQMGPPDPWNPHTGLWPAAEIRGTLVRSPNRAALEAISSPGASSTDGNFVIFSNLDRITGQFYITTTGALLAGNDVSLYPEAWEALPFTPKVAVHATTLSAAVGYISGTKKINLGLYSDRDGLPGAPLRGGQGSITDIPTAGECCDLAKVKLPGKGVALAAGVQVWLVASPDNDAAPDFHGVWQWTNLALTSFKEPEHTDTWITEFGGWLAAEIRGTNP
jgi:hypothetical protein